MTAVGAVLIAGGVTAIGICIAMLVAANERPVVATLPLAEGQWVTLDAPGSYLLRADNMGFTFVFIGLRYTLQAADGQEMPGYRSFSRGSVSSNPLWVFTVREGGSYYLRVLRLPNRDLSPFQLTVARIPPFKGWRSIGGIAAGALLALGGLVMLLV
jgi:hypothetical protein